MGEPKYVQVAARGSAVERARQQARGIPVSAVKALAARLQLPESTILQVIDLKPATYYRDRKKPGKLLPRDKTESVTRLIRLHAQARDTMLDPLGWLQTPSPHLDGATPLQFAATEDGGRVVESLLHRIEFGSVA